ncbi:VapE domain-containing protein [Microvirga mediterraneensis]|uniref:RepB-like DNA primase domain-containing protein n=1 Tax=Microvirga mediterraneensis TaxID=2754695 RepID=A0A838BHA6_9HYPH|nr:VapE domain-containing protein [Microvirga mediterraneensis]MBA1154930.1 hypothetical protein [Microvirga mediterraneensis]
MLDHIIPNTAEAVAFLQAMHPDGPWHLVAMKPDGPPIAQTFDPDNLDAMSAWIEDRQGVENLYFHVNILSPGIRNNKAKKGDVSAAAFLHVDVDDANALSRIEQHAPRPSVVLFSGGGYQAFWRLDAPCSDLERIERRSMRIAAELGGDNCHNIDRIMRVPGTINVPNAKKRAAGRIPTLAYLVTALTDWNLCYPIENFTEQPADRPTFAPISVAITPRGIDDLPKNVSGSTRSVIQVGDDPDRPRTGEAPRYPSRSEAVFHVACELVRAGCAEELIAGVLINPDFGISASILERRTPIPYALKQARSAKAAIENGWPDCDKNGSPRATMRNAAVAIRRLSLSCSFDLFRNRKMVGGQPLEEHQGEISDDACMALRGLIIENFGFDPRSEHVRDAVNLLCLENAFHPIRQLLDGLVWDGVPRIDRWMTNYLGAEDTPLNCAVSRIILIAAVRRIRRPGVKFDQIVVLEGKQGSGKSTAVAILAGPGNHSDQEILTLDAKAQIELLEGVWFYELGEVEGFGKAEVNKIKAFASRTIDRSRMAYAHYSTARPRQAIFIGTTNDDKYLRDLTGNRRFWPVKTGFIDLEALRRDRDQLLAEAANREQQGESISLPEELWEVAAVEQAARLEDDPWLEKLAGERGVAHGDMVRIVTHKLLEETLHIPPERQTQAHTKRLAVLMRQLGWEPKKFNLAGQTIRGYERPKPTEHRDKQAF